MKRGGKAITGKREEGKNTEGKTSWGGKHRKFVKFRKGRAQQKRSLKGTFWVRSARGDKNGERGGVFGGGGGNFSAKEELGRASTALRSGGEREGDPSLQGGDLLFLAILEGNALARKNIESAGDLKSNAGKAKRVD